MLCCLRTWQHGIERWLTLAHGPWALPAAEIAVWQENIDATLKQLLDGSLGQTKAQPWNRPAENKREKEVPGTDILQIQRLKKRKLVLRDRITFIEDQLTPDIIA